MGNTLNVDSFVSIPKEYRNPSFLKFDILANGIRLTPKAYEIIFDNSSDIVSVKRPIRARSGASGGLDIRLRGDIFVNAPIVDDKFATLHNAVLDWKNNRFEISKHGLETEEIEILPEPKFYSNLTNDNAIQMHKIAQMCSPDRLCYDIANSTCRFWNSNDRCRFCSIGLNSTLGEFNMQEDYLYEVLAQAIAEKLWPAHHILIGGGTPQGDDMGAIRAANLCSELKLRFDISVYVMIAAPLQNKYIDLLYESGVDELGMNLEFWSKYAWEHFIPGKKRYIGKKRYMEALKHAVNLFGPIRTRSILVAGLESERDTITAVEELAKIGVMPILSPFRSLKGTALAHTAGFSTNRYVTLFEKTRLLCFDYGLPLGPTCKCCQNNTLTLPFGLDYKWYGTNSQENLNDNV